MNSSPLRLAARWAHHRLTRHRPSHLTIEVTRRCDARCPTCPYWQEEPPSELPDYAPVVRRFRPLGVTLSGGEPLLRSDLPGLIAAIRRADPAVHLGLVTNGSRLTPRLARELRRTGLDHLSLSLDFDGPRHDELRGVPGLHRRIADLLPELTRIGFRTVALNTVLREDNLEEIPHLFDLAWQTGAMLSLSTYCALKTGDPAPLVGPDRLGQLEHLIRYLKDQRRLRPVLISSNAYLDRALDYFRTGRASGCRAGLDWLHITPDGAVRPCSELPEISRDFHQVDPRRHRPVDCDRCWYSCRAWSEAPASTGALRTLWSSWRRSR